MTTDNPLERKALDAHRAYEKDLKSLYDPRTGVPRYPEDELRSHKDRLRALRNEELAEIERDCRDERRLQEENLEKTRHAPPTDILTGDELHAATAKKPYVDADVATLHPKELGKRLEVVIEGADRATRFAYREALRERLRQLREKEGYRFTPIGLSDSLEKLGDSLLPTHQRDKIAVSEGVLEMVGEAEEVAFSLRRGDKTTVSEAYMNSKYKDSMPTFEPSTVPSYGSLPGQGAPRASGPPPRS